MEEFKDVSIHISESWERRKEIIKSVAIERAINMLHESRRREEVLQRKLKLLCQAQSGNLGAGINDISYVKMQLNYFFMQRYGVPVVPSRAEKYNLGEQTTKRTLARVTERGG